MAWIKALGKAIGLIALFCGAVAVLSLISYVISKAVFVLDKATMTALGLSWPNGALTLIVFAVVFIAFLAFVLHED